MATKRACTGHLPDIARRFGRSHRISLSEPPSWTRFGTLCPVICKSSSQACSAVITFYDTICVPSAAVGDNWQIRSLIYSSCFPRRQDRMFRNDERSRWAGVLAHLRSVLSHRASFSKGVMQNCTTLSPVARNSSMVGGCDASKPKTQLRCASSKSGSFVGARSCRRPAPA